ncbi:MAG TPA: heme ABC exporter ATP-binding protein CcmA, partial [Candidatus Saccharimonadales bacterium]|nr:heme ABC exporter ATP-binding protein CcmA [Candidatus Saccharimonadales bacterium]
GLFGPNGAGKTTLLRLLCGLLRPSSGEIRLLGRSIREDAAGARSRLGYLAHASFLYRGLSARENLGFYARLYSVAEPAARIAELLERVGLASRAADPVRTFSRGMLQRLSIARALLHRPEILFLDEPFTGLDREASGILSGLLDETRARQGTVVMVTHDLGRGLGFAGRLLLLSRGRIVDDRPAAGVTASDLEALYASRVKGWVS